MRVQILVIISHLCGFSSATLKSHELLTLCNLIKTEAETISTSWRQYYVEKFISVINNLMNKIFVLHASTCFEHMCTCAHILWYHHT